MSFDDDSDFCESEIEDSGKKEYKLMKQGKHKFKFAENDIMQHTTGIANSRSKSAKHKTNHLALSMYLQTELALVVVQAQPEVEEDPPPIEQNCDELFVHPWTGVAANLPTEWRDREYVGDSGSKLRDRLTRQGFNPIEVNLYGILSAWSFRICSYWYAKKHHGTSFYGYFGKELYQKGNLKTTADILANDIEVKSLKMKEIQCTYNETNASLRNLINQNDKLHKQFNDEILKMQQSTKNHFQRICQEHNKVKSELDIPRKELERCRSEREKQLKQKREAQNETERNKLANFFFFTGKSITAMLNATKNSSLGISGIRRTFHNRNKHWSKIERLLGNLNVLKHMGGDENEAFNRKMDDFHKILISPVTDVINAKKNSKEKRRVEVENDMHVLSEHTTISRFEIPTCFDHFPYFLVKKSIEEDITCFILAEKGKGFIARENCN
ncbi:hypothetical protein MKW94_005670 [Papaver nudicaule]|uniref:Uncharacterized protein n=1 Tax=Papaver nudicaule TaxID=74823 RepID=A0AA41SE84_PAPNU|nr:hypothetical protein [Papaver nudicaule]